MNIFKNEKHRQAFLFITSFLLFITVSFSLSYKHTIPQETKISKVEKLENKMEATSETNKRVSPSYKVTNTTTITGEELDQSLSGEFKGLGDLFVQAAEKNEIDPVFLVAVAAQETGWGQSDIAGAPWNNIGGMICMPGNYQEIFGADYPNLGCEETVLGGTKWQKFISVEDSIQFKAAYLKMKYVDNGKETITEIQQKYAPTNATNDKEGLNNHWMNNVIAIMNSVKEKLFV